MLSPKRVKWRKQHKGRIKGIASRGSSLNFGDFALQAVGSGRLTSRQIEATRITISRCVKRTGKMWIRVFPDKSITSKPAEVRMGKGKGNPEYWVAVVKPGRILFEMSGISKELAQEAFKLAAYKLPFKTRFLARQ